MTIENIRIDTTTKSTVFNPLSASGQWLCSTFGKRSIGNIDAGYPTIVEFTQELPNLKSITLYSEYGDALEWAPVSNFVLVMTVQGVFTMIDTYGMNNPQTFTKIKDSSVEITFNIDGIHEQSGKVFLHSEWKVIKHNIAIMGKKARVKFYKFKHNAYQQPAIQKFCNAVGATLEVIEDPLFGRQLFSVIDESGNWLYDIHHWQSSEPTLHKTMNGWNVLKTKTQKVKGKPIDLVKSISVPPTASRLETDDLICVTIKGHVIKGSSRAQIFSNALCGDWHYNNIDTHSDYNQSAIYELSRFARSDLTKINVYKNSIQSILEPMTQTP